MLQQTILRSTTKKNLPKSLLKFAVLLLVGLVFLSNQAMAQSGARNSAGTAGSSNAGTSQVEIGLEGFCPVCIIEMKEWVKGNPQHAVVADGKRYLFPSNKEKEMFNKDLVKYLPVMGGECVVCRTEMSESNPGSVQFASIHKNRLYLFPADQPRKMFQENPEKYENVDLAFDGDCSVCLIEANRKIPGKADFTVIHNKLRYLFPSEKELEMFTRNPKKYQVAPQR